MLFKNQLKWLHTPECVLTLMSPLYITQCNTTSHAFPPTWLLFSFYHKLTVLRKVNHNRSMPCFMKSSHMIRIHVLLFSAQAGYSLLLKFNTKSTLSWLHCILGREKKLKGANSYLPSISCLRRINSPWAAIWWMLLSTKQKQLLLKAGFYFPLNSI